MGKGESDIMRDDYKVMGNTGKLTTEVENDILEKIHAMSEYTKLSISEITNTALKRFVSGHKDFLPPSASKAHAQHPSRKAG